MKLAVFDEFKVGVVSGESVHDVTAVLPKSLDDTPEQRINWLIRHWTVAEGIVAERAQGVEPKPLAEVTLRPCSPAPSHVFALPANYRTHIGELGDRSVSKGRSAREQGFFLKAPGSLTGADEAIQLPRGSDRRFDHECELAVVIGSTTSHVPREQALDHVFGYACLIDVTMRIERDRFEEERSMRKSFSSFTPLGPCLVTADEVGDPQELTSRLSVNGELRQSARLADMIVGVAEAIELISSVVPLQPGDVIASGTPAGVGQLRPGDVVQISIDRLGSMQLPVVEREAAAPRPY